MKKTDYEFFGRKGTPRKYLIAPREFHGKLLEIAVIVFAFNLYDINIHSNYGLGAVTPANSPLT